MDCTVISMNANGCVIQGQLRGRMEIPRTRKDVMQKVINDEDPDLILIQESDIALKSICTQNFENRDYQAIGGKDVGIIYDTKTFILLHDITKIFRQKYQSLYGGPSYLYKRMYAVIFEGKNSNIKPFPCVSWHGPNKKKPIQKQNLFDNLCLCIRNIIYLYLRDEKQTAVILGGDFNLALNKISIPLILQPELMFNDYKTLDHRPKKIDYILTSVTITNVSCKPVNVFNIIKELFPDFPFKYNKSVLDHDPVVMKFTIPTK